MPSGAGLRDRAGIFLTDLDSGMASDVADQIVGEPPSCSNIRHHTVQHPGGIVGTPHFDIISIHSGSSGSSWAPKSATLA